MLNKWSLGRVGWMECLWDRDEWRRFCCETIHPGGNIYGQWWTCGLY